MSGKSMEQMVDSTRAVKMFRDVHYHLVGERGTSTSEFETFAEFTRTIFLRMG